MTVDWHVEAEGKGYGLMEGSFFMQGIVQLGQNLTEHLAVAPLLKSAMDGLVVGIELGQQVPLRARVQNQGVASKTARAGRVCARGDYLECVLLENVPESVPTDIRAG